MREGSLNVHGDVQFGGAGVSTWNPVLTGSGEAPTQVRAFAKPRTSALSKIYGTLKKGLTSADVYSRLHDRVVFDDRRTGAAVVVCMLAGYESDLWRFVMPRFRAALPEADVCIISPGLRHDRLAELCRRQKWSYLSTATNDVALAQNVCFRLHDRAKMIVKLDEDMFLLPDTITKLLTAHRDIKVEGVVDPGFVAPMIPLNGFCYRHLLEMLGLLDEYEAEFGRARLATSGLAVHNDPAAARWIWERTAPLAATAERLDALPPRVLLCPIQFSIGLIAFERRFWEQIGYFAVHRSRLLAGLGTLGSDEAYLCARAMEMSRPAVVTTSCLAGHFSFGPQYAGLKALLDEQPELFSE
jgi:hypothetical protein